MRITGAVTPHKAQRKEEKKEEEKGKKNYASLTD
jgi:hypothetical protein